MGQKQQSHPQTNDLLSTYIRKSSIHWNIRWDKFGENFECVLVGNGSIQEEELVYIFKTEPSRHLSRLKGIQDTRISDGQYPPPYSDGSIQNLCLPHCCISKYYLYQTVKFSHCLSDLLAIFYALALLCALLCYRFVKKFLATSIKMK